MESYTEARRRFFNHAAKRWKKTLPDIDAQYVRYILASVVPPAELGRRLLDLGCGTGILFPFVTSWEVTALDISEEMLSAARQKHAPHIVEYVHGDAHRLPFPDESFACVVMLSVLPHLEKTEQVMREVFRVLKSRGTVVLLHLHTAETITAIHAAMGGAVAQDRLPEVTELKTMMCSLRFEVCFEDGDKRVTLVCRKSS